MIEVLKMIDWLRENTGGNITIKGNDTGIEIRVHWRQGSFGKYFYRSDIRGRAIVGLFIQEAKKTRQELIRRAKARERGQS